MFDQLININKLEVDKNKMLFEKVFGKNKDEKNDDQKFDKKEKRKWKKWKK